MHAIIFIVSFVSAVSLQAVALKSPACSITGPRNECGYYGITSQECTSKGCCWGPTTSTTSRAQPGSNRNNTNAMKQPQSGLKDTPWCFYPNGPSEDTYLVQSVRETELGFTLRLSTSPSTRKRRRRNPLFQHNYQELQVDAWYEATSRVRVRVAPVDTPVWEVPPTLLPRPPPPPARPPNLALQIVPPAVGEPFGFSVRRLGVGGQPGGTLFNTSGHPLVFKPQFIELTTSLPASSSLYGLGDTVQREGWRLVRDGRAVTLWAADAFAGSPSHNVYSAHPFYMEVCEDGSSHGVMMMNSNAMDVILEPETITYRMTGGVIDLYLLAGPTPESVVEQYHGVIGLPAMPPRWALGFHQCRWGYKDIQELNDVLEGYKAANIPLEVLWSDIDYMLEYRDFTFHPDRYPLPEMKALVQRLHTSNQRWVPIIDPGIPLVPGYEAYDRGIAEGIFIKDRTGAPLLGEVWPGPTHWPDFLHPSTSTYWADLLRGMWQQVPFDGLWIDMNEASNFCPGEVCWMPQTHTPHTTNATSASNTTKTETHPQGESTPSPPPPLRSGQPSKGGQGHFSTTGVTAHGKPHVSWSEQAAWAVHGGGSGVDATGWRAPNCMVQCRDPEPSDPLSHPPYAVNNQNNHLPLGWKTLTPSAVHYGGILEYDAHNLYGLAEAKMTYPILQQLTGTRPFILTRSTSPGSGAYAARWTGDNGADWENLQWSVPGLFNSWAWGTPMTGSDICGFHGDTQEELCARWLSAGAFYPFSRDHSDLNSHPQEPYRWPATAHAARTALALRYALLPYLYTAHYLASRMGGGVARPLLARWPGWEDARGGSAADRQWLLGDSVLVAPVLEGGQEAVRGAWVPPGSWYSAWDYGHVLTGPAHMDVPAPLGHVPVFYGEGSILPLHSPGMTTHEVVRTPLTLVVVMRRAECPEPSQQGLSLLSDPRPTNPTDAAGTSSSSSTGVPSKCWCAVRWSDTQRGEAPPKATTYLSRSDTRSKAAHMAAPAQGFAGPRKRRLLAAWSQWLLGVGAGGHVGQTLNVRAARDGGDAGHGGADLIDIVQGARHLSASTSPPSLGTGSSHSRSKDIEQEGVEDVPKWTGTGGGHKAAGQEGYAASVREVEVGTGMLYADDGSTLQPGQPGSTLEAHMTVSVVPALHPPAVSMSAEGEAAITAAQRQAHAPQAQRALAAAGWCGGTCAGVLTYRVGNAARAQQQKAGSPRPMQTANDNERGAPDQAGAEPDDPDTNALHALVIGKVVVMPVEPLPSSAPYAAILNGHVLPASALTYNATAKTLTIELNQSMLKASPGSPDLGADRVIYGQQGTQSNCVSAWLDFELEWGPAFVLPPTAGLT